jgi:hypothetical protein
LNVYLDSGQIQPFDGMPPRPTGNRDTAVSHILLPPAFRHVRPLVTVHTFSIKTDASVLPKLRRSRRATFRPRERRNFAADRSNGRNNNSIYPSASIEHWDWRESLLKGYGVAALVNDTTGRLNQIRSPLPFLVDNARLAGKDGWLGIRAGICGQSGEGNCVEHVGVDRH